MAKKKAEGREECYYASSYSKGVDVSSAVYIDNNIDLFLAYEMALQKRYAKDCRDDDVAKAERIVAKAERIALQLTTSHITANASDSLAEMLNGYLEQMERERS
jgi:hypothetical protein